MNKQNGFFQGLEKQALLFRVSSHFTLAAISAILPAVGPNRFWLAGLLIFVGSPAAILVNRRVKGISRNWAEALVDLLMVISLIHLVPQLWMVGMALGLMVALAPSISLHPSSHWIYMCFGGTLITGMTFAALIHNVQNWELVILAVTVSYPALLFYTYSQMQAANELQKRAEMVQGMTQLAGSVAHDFNNMLMGISGYTEVTLAGLPENHEARINLQKVLEGTRRASLLTNRLLSFAGHDIGQKERINVVAEFRVIADLLRPALPSGTKVTLNNADEVLFVEANVTDLHQVWMNVLLNAGESMQGEQGEIEVDVSKLEPAEQAATGQIAMLISDRGSGISHDQLKDVFDPFYTTKKKGHGLGLAVCRRIMSQLGGRIEIRAREGGGTEVLIVCPEAPSQESSVNEVSPAIDLPATQVNSLLVLVVDDEPDIRMVAEGLLTSLGHEVLTACDADEAVAVFTGHHERIGAVLLDLKMPGRDGWSCLQDLRKISANKPVIICSGFNPIAGLPDFAIDDAKLAFLTKPFQGEQLAEALNKV